MSNALLTNESLTLFSIIRTVARGLAVVLVSVVLTLFVPGVVAHIDKVFYDDEVRLKPVVANLPTASEYDAQQKRLKNTIASLRARIDAITDLKNQAELDFDVKLLDQRTRELTDLAPPVFPIGFFLSAQMLLWPAIYSSLGCLLVCFPKPELRSAFKVKAWHLAWLGTLIYIYYEWPLWTRNFLLNSHGRTVYAYTNFDIDPKSFFVQELTIAGFAFLIAATWIRWSDKAAKVDRENNIDLADHGGYLNARFVISLQTTFYEWIASSIMLGLGFAYFTTFFWSLVATYHDPRYIMSAFLAHSLWALTWIFLSIPVLKYWNSLKMRRLRAIEDMMRDSQSIPGKSEQIDIDGLEKLEALAGIRISIAGVGAVVSLLLPIIQLFLHK